MIPSLLRPNGGPPTPAAAPPDTASDPMLAAVDALRADLNAALRGKAPVIERVLACLLAGGHLLLEDMPGLGKTTLAKALARGLGGRFARVQCTPDLLPGDVTGFSIFNQKTREFEFQPGPVFADVLLVDEINRATPRAQSALLEAMAEQQATVDGTARALSDTFFVIATQNPGDHHGTYPLPEAQLDRFAMRLSIGYPDREDEIALLGEATQEGGIGGGRADAAGPILDGAVLLALRKRVARLSVGRPVREYLVALAHAARAHPQAALGLSPRGLLVWQRTAQAHSFLVGRDFVTPDDVQAVAPQLLGVRMAAEAALADRIAREVLAAVPVPGYR